MAAIFFLTLLGMLIGLFLLAFVYPHLREFRFWCIARKAMKGVDTEYEELCRKTGGDPGGDREPLALGD